MIDVIARLREIAPMHGGACMNEIGTLIREMEGEARAKSQPQAGAGAPVVVDVPHATQEGPTTLNCTMGNWQGEPTSYEYLWHRDGSEVSGGGEAQLTITAPDDIGHEFVCEVTAINAAGSTSVTSNPVVATDQTG